MIAEKDEDLGMAKAEGERVVHSDHPQSGHQNILMQIVQTESSREVMNQGKKRATSKIK